MRYLYIGLGFSWVFGIGLNAAYMIPTGRVSYVRLSDSTINLSVRRRNSPRPGGFTGSLFYVPFYYQHPKDGEGNVFTCVCLFTVGYSLESCPKSCLCSCLEAGLNRDTPRTGQGGTSNPRQGNFLVHTYCLWSHRHW